MFDFIKNKMKSLYKEEDSIVTCGHVKFTDVDADTVMGYIAEATKVEVTLGRMVVYYKDGICWDGALHLPEYVPVPRYLQRRMMISTILLPPYCITPFNINNNIQLEVHISRDALMDLNPPDDYESSKNEEKPEKEDKKPRCKKTKRIINIKE